MGHGNSVRGISWHCEIPWLVFTGSWDYTVKAWDIRSGSCVYTLFDHHSDVYGIATHPDRPFTLVTCSRDNTLRFWSIEEQMMTIMLKVLMNAHADEVVGAAGELEQEKAGTKLCGAAGAILMRKVQQGEYHSPADKCRDLFRFFSVQYSSMLHL